MELKMRVRILPRAPIYNEVYTMTTNASVTTHTWPVAVIAVDHPALQEGADPIATVLFEKMSLVKVIPPNTPGVPHDVTLWQGRSILLVEMPAPPKEST
jgi:hypothetical protein